jgi:hypothetical protein
MVVMVVMVYTEAEAVAVQAPQVVMQPQHLATGLVAMVEMAQVQALLVHL